MARPVLLYPPLPLCIPCCKVLLVPGGGLAGGWALAREGSNPSPSACISLNKAAPLPLFTLLPRRGVLGNPLAAYREVMRQSTPNAPFLPNRHLMLPQHVVGLDRYAGLLLARSRSYGGTAPRGIGDVRDVLSEHRGGTRLGGLACWTGAMRKTGA
jgi:hypothetical protein